MIRPVAERNDIESESVFPDVEARPQPRAVPLVPLRAAAAGGGAGRGAAGPEGAVGGPLREGGVHAFRQGKGRPSKQLF